MVDHQQEEYLELALQLFQRDYLQVQSLKQPHLLLLHLKRLLLRARLVTLNSLSLLLLTGSISIFKVNPMDLTLLLLNLPETTLTLMESEL